MRILHIIYDLTGGGAEQQLNYLAPELVKKGHEVHLIFCNQGPNKYDLDGVRIHQIAEKDHSDWRLFLKLFSLTRKIRPDITHTWLLKMDFLGGLVAKMMHIPWVFREPSSRLAYPRGFKHSIRIVFSKFADAVICNSKGGVDYWKNDLPARKIHFVKNGLPISRIKLAQQPVPQKEDASFVIMGAGRLVPEKRFDVLIDSFQIIRRKKKQVLLIICGDGPSYPDLMKKVRDNNLSDFVKFTGFLPQGEIWELMKSADVFVSLSEFEGCPNTVLEAMACGIPVVLSRIPAHDEIADRTNAIVVNETNQQDAAEAVLEILRFPEAASQRAENAKIMADSYSTENMVVKHEQIYEDCVSKVTMNTAVN